MPESIPNRHPRADEGKCWEQQEQVIPVSDGQHPGILSVRLFDGLVSHKEMRVVIWDIFMTW